MALETIRKTTLAQRFRRLLLGKEKPNLLTRISVISGFVVWLYLFSWQMLTCVSILLLGQLDQSNYVRATYNHVGSAYKTDIINLLFLHSIIQIGIYFLILFSLILIWRRIKVGFLIYVLGYLTTLAISFFLMGVNFLVKEIPLVDYILILTSVLYFSIGIFIFYGRKKEGS